MNSQFKNSNLGFYLYAAIILIIAFASIFVVWYMVKGYSLGTYPENTIIGSVYIGGLKEDEVEPIITERTTKWLNDESIVFELTYQGYSYEFDRSLFYFDQELSMFNLIDGETNILYAKYQGTVRTDVIYDIENLDFLNGINDKFDYKTIINDTLKAAGYMKSYSSLDLEDYIIEVDDFVSEVGSITIDLHGRIDVDNLIDGINEVYSDGKIIAEKKELFDIVEKFGDSLADNEMSILSTGILALILETNFAVNEVHYLAEIDYINYNMDTFPYFGHNASVNQVIGNSFSFYNPNNFSYYFTVEKIDEVTIIITIVGLIFVDNIKVEIHKTILDHITQYTLNDDILQSGYDGAIIEIVRVITDLSGNVRHDNVILFEFYPPIKEIVIEP